MKASHLQKHVFRVRLVIFALLQHLQKSPQNGFQMDVDVTLKSLQICVRGFPKAIRKICVKMDTPHFDENAILE